MGPKLGHECSRSVGKGDFCFARDDSGISSKQKIRNLKSVASAFGQNWQSSFRT